MTFTANLDSTSGVVDPTLSFSPTDSNTYTSSYTTSVYDSLGNEHTVGQYFVKTGDNSWQVHYTFDGEEQTATTALQFDTSGKLVSPTSAVPMTFTPDGADPIALTLDYGSTSQYGSDFSVATNSADGYASAEQNGVQVDSDGKVYATYSNGERMLQGQVVLATFPDENGLQAVSGTAWQETGESGSPLIGAPGTGTCDTLSAGYLEGSNVDITSELVDLMTAQRNYQANTKVISASNQLDQALFQAM